MKIIKEDVVSVTNDVDELNAQIRIGAERAIQEYFRTVLVDAGHPELGVALRDMKPFPVVVFDNRKKAAAVSVGYNNFQLKNTGEKFKDAKALIDGVVVYLNSDKVYFA